MKYAFSSLLVFVLLLTSCKKDVTTSDKETTQAKDFKVDENGQFFKLSLAQWSLHKPILDGTMSPMDFAKEAKRMGFDGIEYVSALYKDEIAKYESTEEAIEKILVPLKLKSEHYGVENLIIMVDEEGDLASADPKERNRAVANHSTWIDAAEYLGCHSIRVNLFGNEDNQRDWMTNAVSSLKRIATYGAQKNINVIVENHGGFSSNAAMLHKVMLNVNLPNCGTLPDFGNFCLEREGGARWSAPCIKEYDKYKGVEEMMPFAKAVSAKAYAFDDDGEETTIDYKKMMAIIKEAKYSGYIGVEYEGENPKEGILATKALLLKAAKELK